MALAAALGMLNAVCNRFDNHSAASFDWEPILGSFDLRCRPEGLYNVSPGFDAPVFARNADAIVLLPARWGFPRGGAPRRHAIGVNAAAGSAGLRRLVAGRRCLVPVDGWYQWGAQDPGQPQPHYLHRVDRKPMLLAGIWDFAGPQRERCFALLQVSAPKQARYLGAFRPLVMAEDRARSWLDMGTTGEELDELLLPWRPRDEGESIVFYQTALWVNDPRHQGENCLNRALASPVQPRVGNFRL